MIFIVLALICFVLLAIFTWLVFSKEEKVSVIKAHEKNSAEKILETITKPLNDFWSEEKKFGKVHEDVKPKESKEVVKEETKDAIPQKTIDTIKTVEVVEGEGIKSVLSEKVTVSSANPPKVFLKTGGKRYAKAYEKWSKSQEKRLKDLFKEGKKVSEIARALKRKPGAIKSRIRFLKLA